MVLTPSNAAMPITQPSMPMPLTLSIIVAALVSWLRGVRRPLALASIFWPAGRTASKQAITFLLRISWCIRSTPDVAGGHIATITVSLWCGSTVTALKYSLHKLPDGSYTLPLQRQPPMQPGKVPRHDRAPQVAALGALSLALQRHGDMADFRLRFAVKNNCLHLQRLSTLIVIGGARLSRLTLCITALGFEGTVVNALLMPGAVQGMIDMLGPLLTPLT